MNLVNFFVCNFREIGRMDPKELSRDSSGTRAYAAFLVELARCVPAVMLPSISVLLVLLDGEVVGFYLFLDINVRTSWWSDL